MNRGGVETWLMNILRNISRNDVAFDFLVHKGEGAAYDGEITDLGAKRIFCRWPDNPIKYGWNFIKILRENGPYDVIHSHVHHFSGFVLLLAWLAGVPIRIAHSHSSATSELGTPNLRRTVYYLFTKYLIQTTSTVGLAASEKAAVSLFGDDWADDKRWKVVYCGVDLSAFDIKVDKVSMRKRLGISDNAFVIGHVGRFDKPKNHQFLLEVFNELQKIIPTSVLLLVGDGALKSTVQDMSQELGISDKVIFTGAVSNVSEIMLGCMDIFVFPSINEGLGLALIEAQAANLVCIVSDSVPYEVKISKGVYFIPLNIGSAAWANIISMNINQRNNETNDIEKFSLENSIHNLKQVYHVI
ncbi:glycosyltransferase family 1 protein [uncultured Deinococcus sp.]|uniref:glycosyltransferase family 1 protein n=1 Tax=uncultured Deinococcus sp. TaxID=158789 RepID=UPI0025EFDC4B|nr:glycosyltransferase family 1 protein [uncultured Deinococcus sp.]